MAEYVPVDTGEKLQYTLAFHEGIFLSQRMTGFLQQLQQIAVYRTLQRDLLVITVD
ncbi:hypothetical protein D3C75_1377660 [compost metagenome]